jgi:prepilin-type N-terminal cleavage/methylation domain-containing protein/prepilin-type processing-associated H-X9-DG protein
VRGFTLIELLVVITIIGILIALLLPAVNSIRATARKLECSSNMRNIALALVNHETQYKHFPHGVYNYLDSTFKTPAPYNDWQDRRCWMHQALPFLEQAALYDLFNEHMKVNKSALAFEQSDTVIPVLMCPSDSTSPKTHTFWGGLGKAESQGFSGNMIVCAGSEYFNEGGVENSAKLNGMFFAQSKVRNASILDGASNTIMVSELILSPDTDSHDIRGRYYNPAHGGVLFSTRVTPNTLVPDRLNWCGKTPVARAPCIYTGQNMFVSARSFHSGGVNVAMAGGSCHFVTNEIDADVYSALGTRNGGESTGTPF